VVVLTLANVALAIAFTPAVIWLTRRHPFERGRWPASFAVHALACLFFCVSHTGVYYLLCYASHGVLGLLLFQRVHPNVLTYWAIVGFTEAVRHFESARRRERQLAEARLALLRAQLQPHFLFNTLNTIAAMMHEDVAAADQMINRLSDLLRLALDGAAAHETTLDREIHFAQAYVDIHRARFGGGLALRLDVGAGMRSSFVPSLILQPLVENAIRHGFSAGRRGGTITIEAREREGALRLRILDDGCGPGEAQPGEPGLGLENVRQRLEHLYPGVAGLALEPGDTGGAVVTVTLPLRRHVEATSPDGAAMAPLFGGAR
jgi:two-component system, LytTR family, sensor kinase